MSSTLILASQSPRRAELLQQLGLAFDTCPVDIDETVGVKESANAYVTRLALEKAQTCLRQTAGRDDNVICLGSDTAVVIDEHILGKPANAGEAAQMLQKLSGRTHEVLTGVALASKQKAVSCCQTTRVRFRALTATEIDAYWRTGEPADKAGGYAIQGQAAIFIEHIDGSYSGVMGLPLFETAQLLREFDFPLL
jgi:septum formation protein